MANIPVNQNGTILSAGQSISGSFYGFVVCALSGSLSNILTANFTAMKVNNGGNLLSGSLLSFIPGTKVDLNIISASLDVNSAPVLLYL